MDVCAAVAVLNAIALCRIGSRSCFVFVWCWGKRGRMADWSFGGMSMWSTWRRDINTWAPHMLFLTPGKVQLCNSSELENSQRDSWTSRWSAELFIQRCNDCRSLLDLSLTNSWWWFVDFSAVDHGYATGSYTHWQCSINTTVRQYAIDQSISFHDARFLGFFHVPHQKIAPSFLLHAGFKSCFLHEDPIDKSF